MKPLPSSLAFVTCGSIFLAISAHGQDSVPSFVSQQGATVQSQVAQQPSPHVLQLVAPVALYPDALLAEILTAATYPSEVSEASRWVRQHTALVGQPRENAVNAQLWDASVKGLTEFPSVLENMTQNLSWTTALGNAYAGDAGAVMEAVQFLRRRAESTGTLASTIEQDVTTSGQAIVIDPHSPDVIYVPAYDPWLVYGMAIPVFPGWIDASGVFYAGRRVVFGVGLDEGAFPTYHWGWHDWKLDWRHRSVSHGERRGTPTQGLFRKARPEASRDRTDETLTTHDLATQDFPEHALGGEFHEGGRGEAAHGGGSYR